MRLGLIGWPLGHSWSKEIHEFFLPETYELIPLRKEELESFIRKKEFDGLNVTIPYKQKVMDLCDEIDETAASIGAVNCIVNHDGKLTGYNTDYEGLRQMIVNKGFDMKDADAAILGSGGASKAAKAAVESLGGIPHIVSRTKKEGCITYEELYASQKKYSYLINTTPLGMSPHYDEIPADLKKFDNLKGVIDVIANPLHTRLRYEAQNLGIPSLGGFEMLVRQAFAADEKFTGKKMDSSLIPECMHHVLMNKANIALIGMPTSGKTTICAKLGEMLDKPVIETDDEIVKLLGMDIPTCFETKGEAYFRQTETQVIKDLRAKQGCIISCGGGVVKNEENMRILSENGIIIWLKRPLEMLFPSSSRPLSSTNNALKKLYSERAALYEKYSTMSADNDLTIEEAAAQIARMLKGVKDI